MKVVGSALIASLCGCSVMSMPRHPGPTCVTSEEAALLDVVMAGLSAAATVVVYEQLECNVEPCLELQHIAVVPGAIALGYGLSSVVGFVRVDTCRGWKARHPDEVEPEPAAPSRPPPWVEDGRPGYWAQRR